MKKSMTKPKEVSFLDDVKWAFRQVGGRKKLLELCADDKFLKSLYIDVARLELREKEIALSKQGPPRGDTIFVIKGLHKTEEKEFVGKVDESVLKLRASLFPAGVIEEFIEEEPEQEVQENE
jgi:hypothetical protein